MRNGSLSRRCNVPTYSKCVQEFQRLLYIVDYWQKQGWQNEGLFAYGVRKIRPFFVSKHPLFHQMTAVQQRSALNLWKLFYQKAEGERFLSALAGRDRQLADLLNSAEPVPNGWGASCWRPVPCFPDRRGRYYSCKRKMLAEHFFPSLPQWVSKRKRFSGRAV